MNALTNYNQIHIERGGFKQLFKTLDPGYKSPGQTNFIETELSLNSMIDVTCNN